MHEIIDLPRIPEDDSMPDGATHLIYVKNPLSDTIPYVPIVISGYQWDMLWWIYRLWNSNGSNIDFITFDMFALEYIEKVYENYLKRKS
jgi:hypothetical protein